MKKWTLTFACLAMIFGLVWLLRSNLSPHPVKLIKPSYLASPEKIGQLLWKRYKDRFEGEDQWIFGIQPEDPTHLRVFSSFIEASGRKFAKRIKEVRVDVKESEESKWEDIDLNSHYPKFPQMLKEKQKQLFLLPNTYVSHLIRHTPVRKAEKQLRRKFISLSLVGFVLRTGDLDKIYPPCDGYSALGEETAGNLGCSARRKSVITIRKNMDKSRYVIAMEQNGEKDYLLYVWTPEISAK